jgi:outer membrane protein OmpA-like peptidoglycan-associated protein
MEPMSMKTLVGMGLSVAMAAGWMAPGALAAPVTGCAPAGHLSAYDAGERTTRAYDRAEFSVGTEDDSKTVVVAGATCTQPYMIKDGVDPLSDLEIQSNYRDQLSKLGAKIVYTDDNDTVGELVKDGRETWIKVYSEGTEINVTVVDKQPLVDTLTAPSGVDDRLLGHMPGYTAGEPTKRNFDKADFTVQQGDDTQTVSVEGALYDINYTVDGDLQESDVAIQQNYRDALAKLGALVLYTDDNTTTARIEHDGRTTWLKIYSEGSEIDVTAIDEKPFAASIQPPTADAMKTALDKDGHVALYVNFDFNKATLRPDAKPVIDQVAALLKNDAALKLEVDGYTDNVGADDYNVKLSQARAASVVAALKADGADISRLSSNGFGPANPIADESTAEGRAKNRRVELVKK